MARQKPGTADSAVTSEPAPERCQVDVAGLVACDGLRRAVRGRYARIGSLMKPGSGDAWPRTVEVFAGGSRVVGTMANYCPWCGADVRPGMGGGGSDAA